MYLAGQNLEYSASPESSSCLLPSIGNGVECEGIQVNMQMVSDSHIQLACLDDEISGLDLQICEAAKLIKSS
jgi:hypothetical protein